LEEMIISLVMRRTPQAFSCRLSALGSSPSPSRWDPSWQPIA